ncbi:sortilin-related receptor-like [Gigantopelta aegis]|uniref:sortilin-related receptor-like n=1 Tax=Gigantopelta aegis TaxID=1735272 RepID=UPI001B88B411|nr:sortilin-related receptor-like [Gigantopelta aegis]
MAIEKWKYFCFVFIFMILSSTHGKNTRFGQRADSLFFPAESDSSVWTLQIDSVEEDEVDRMLKRYARSPTATDAPPKTNRSVSEFHLNDNHTTLIVHWAGKGSDVILALSKNGLKGSDSNVFISRNYGKAFTKINDKFQLRNGANAVIDRYYNMKQYNSHYVFTDIINQCVFTTRDFAMSVTAYCNLPFKPRTISIHEMNPSIILAMDEESVNKQLYISENFGFSWRPIHDHVKAFFWGVVPYDNNTDIYLEEIRGSFGNRVWKSNDYFRSTRNKVQLISGVRDFQVKDQYLFATKHVHLLGPRIQSATTQLWVSYNRKKFRKAEFPSHMHQEEFYIADASESQVMACVNHNRTVTHLYVSEVQGLKFSLSLERVVYFNPRGANNDTWLRYYANVTFADIHKVDGMRGIYIASQVINGTFDVNHQRSLITFDKGGEWRLLRAPDYDSAGRRTNCSLGQVAQWSKDKVNSCSLHVTQMLNQFYPGSRSVPILSRRSAPGIILASGVIGKNIKSNPDVFVSTNAGISWHQVLDGNYMYTFADHGGIIVAVKQFASTDTIFVSYDEGKLWEKVKFSHVKIRVYGILTEPGETTSIFSIFGSHLGRHSWIISQIDLRPS